MCMREKRQRQERLQYVEKSKKRTKRREREREGDKGAGIIPNEGEKKSGSISTRADDCYTCSSHRTEEREKKETRGK